jgi:hypothetical protein
MSSVTVWQALFSAVLDAPKGRVSDYFLMSTLGMRQANLENKQILMHLYQARYQHRLRF